MTEIRLEGAIEKRAAQEICEQIRIAHPNIKFSTGECLQVYGLVSGAEAISMVSMISGLIGTILAIWTRYDRQNETHRWTYKHLLKVLADEMATQNVASFHVEKIDGFEHLVLKDHETCTLTVKDKKTGVIYEVRVHHGGQITTFCIM
jgi:hypothetical protein